MTVEDKWHRFEEAMAMLQAASIPVRREAYGFSIIHPDFNVENRPFGVCGREHDWSISLSLSTEEHPPNVWFFRFDFLEMAQLVLEAYANCPPNPSRKEILHAMRTLDDNYDHEKLKSRIAQWCVEMSEKTGLDYSPP